MTRRLLTTCILLLVLAAAVFAWDPPTEIPNDSYFPILEFGDQNGFLLTTGIKGMGSSVLATRYGFFGRTLVPRYPQGTIPLVLTTSEDTQLSLMMT